MSKRKLLPTAFAVYLVLVAAITIVPVRMARFRVPRSNHINLTPLGFSFTCLPRVWTAHPDLIPFCLRNTLGNIALFLPLGIFLPLLSSRFRSLKRILLVAALLSLGIETIQFLARFFGNSRAVDIDDVLLNTLGALIGYVIYKFARRTHPSTPEDHTASAA